MSAMTPSRDITPSAMTPSGDDGSVFDYDESNAGNLLADEDLLAIPVCWRALPHHPKLVVTPFPAHDPQEKREEQAVGYRHQSVSSPGLPSFYPVGYPVPHSPASQGGDADDEGTAGESSPEHSDRYTSSFAAETVPRTPPPLKRRGVGVLSHGRASFVDESPPVRQDVIGSGGLSTGKRAALQPLMQPNAAPLASPLPGGAPTPQPYVRKTPPRPP